jgi:hypothetical protein
MIAGLNISSVKESLNGELISTLGLERLLSKLDCKLCRLLYSARIEVDIRTEAGAACYELRAISFLKNYNGIKYKDIEKSLKDALKDSINLAVLPTSFENNQDPDVLKSHFWRKGHIFFSNSRPTTFSARVIPRKFDPQTVRKWLGYCGDNHTRLCHAPVNAPRTKLIDCQHRRVVTAPSQAKYVALSYTRGKLRKLSGSANNSNYRNDDLLPPNLPQVVEDAILVTRALGFQYLWVDQICINQQDPAELRKQIAKMDQVYMGSQLTIIAAAGDGENCGLPGVGTTRRTPQPMASFGNITVLSRMPHPHHTIKLAKHSTRGWTLQESILSPRRLVFTDEQVYYECNGMNCFESLHIPLDRVHAKAKDKSLAFVHAGLFTGRDEGLCDPILGLAFGTFDDVNKDWSYQFKKYLILATNYTIRDLSHDSDSLNAFAGIMRHLERETWRYPISQLLGLPYAILPNEAKQVDCMVAALCWRHIECCWSGASSAKRIRRRAGFPAWTWAGWAGAISWTDLFTNNNMDLQSLVDHFQCELEDGTTIGLQQYTSQRRSRHPYTWFALRFSAWLVQPDMISLYESSNEAPCWSIGCSFSWELQLHISEFEGSPGEFLETLRNGLLECIFVAKGIYNSYFLILEPQGASSRRIGAAEVMYGSSGAAYRKFADEVAFHTTKKEFRLI